MSASWLSIDAPTLSIFFPRVDAVGTVGFSIRLCPVWTDKASGNDRLPVARPVFPEPRSCPDGKSVEPAVRLLRQPPVSSGPRRKEMPSAVSGTGSSFGSSCGSRPAASFSPAVCGTTVVRLFFAPDPCVCPVFLSPSHGPSCRFFRQAERKTHIRPLRPVSGRIPSREDRRRYRAR